jgi:hypothetical protein
MMNTMHNQCANRYGLLAITAASTLLFCSTLAATEDGVPAQPATTESSAIPENSRPGAVGLVVNGTSAGITPDYFEQAAAEALLESGIFSKIVTPEKSKVAVSMIRSSGTFSSELISEDTPYFLNIRIIEVDAPSFSIRMTVGMNVFWTLYRTAGKTEFLHEKIHSTYTGSAFEGGLSGANRARVATEGATRENVRMGMALLESLDLKVE